MTLPAPTFDDLTGRTLYGEGLDDAGIAAWFASEEQGYFELTGGARENPTGAVHRHHALRHLPPRRYATALALGAADGGEYGIFAGQVDRFIAIEPGRGFWRDRIAGAPAEYRMPTPRGTIDLPDGVCDLACSFGVLHHIPNVSEVLAELARVLAPGAPLILREPIVSLGDFRRPRPGLTTHERGIPRALMGRMLAEAGFTVRAHSLAGFPGLQQIARRLGLRQVWDNRAFVLADAAASWLMAWNARYWRPRLWDKAAPTMGYWVAIRDPLPSTR